MYLKFTCDPDLPKLAWLAILEKNISAIRVVHGAWVETGDDFFFEGAWSSEFGKRGFDSDIFLAGSGAKLKGDTIVFCPPSHTLARINMARRNNLLYISNSFAFCLSASGGGLKKNYPLYFRDFQSIIRGLNRYTRRIRLDTGHIDLFYVDNIAIHNNLDLNPSARRSPPAFSTYSEYYTLLSETLKNLKNNALSNDRNIRYNDVISTISSGYDSTACAALAKQIGCKDAITFVTARDNKSIDSGYDSAHCLGFSVIEADRLEYKKMTTCPEAEFIATGTASDGGDLIFAPFEEVLRQKIFVTGFTGDNVWSMRKLPDRFMSRGDASGSMLEEFRIRVGFVHLPIPFIGAMRHPELREISLSKEMRPWALNQGYDRPIARRIAEEAGIPRGHFGQSKKAVGARMFDHHDNDCTDMKPFMCPVSYQDYKEYYENTYKSNFREKYNNFVRLPFMAARRFLAACNRRVLHRVGIELSQFGIWKAYVHKLGRNWIMFHWSVEKIVRRYQTTATKQLISG